MHGSWWKKISWHLDHILNVTWMPSYESCKVRGFPVLFFSCISLKVSFYKSSTALSRSDHFYSFQHCFSWVVSNWGKINGQYILIFLILCECPVTLLTDTKISHYVQVMGLYECFPPPSFSPCFWGFFGPPMGAFCTQWQLWSPFLAPLRKSVCRMRK